MVVALIVVGVILLFLATGIKIVPQNQEHKEYILNITGLRKDDFTQMGLLNLRRTSLNSGISESPETESDIISIPKISKVNPTKIVPRFFFLSLFAIIINAIPIIARMGEKF